MPIQRIERMKVNDFMVNKNRSTESLKDPTMTYMGIVCIPYVPTWNTGKHTYVITPTFKTNNKTVLLYDHHEYDDPIGTIELTYMPVQSIEGGYLNIVLGIIKTSRTLRVGQGLSLDGTLDASRSSDLIDVIGDIVGVSIVDVPHIRGCQLVDTNTFMSFINNIADSVKKVATHE